MLSEYLCGLVIETTGNVKANYSLSGIGRFWLNSPLGNKHSQSLLDCMWLYFPIGIDNNRKT